MIPPFPELRALAEREARDLFEAIHVHHGMLSAHAEGAVVEAILDLLRDPSRPASRDALTRLVAEKVGLAVGATAPELVRQCTERVGWWALRCDRRERMFAEDPTMFPTPGVAFGVPGISAITDPTLALAAIIAALWPE